VLVLELRLRARIRVNIRARVRDHYGYETPGYEMSGSRHIVS